MMKDKILILYAVFLTLPCAVFSQVVFSKNFENLGCNSFGGCSGDGHSETVITDSCFPNGGTSHGSPHISGNKYAQMGSRVEGIFMDFEFEPGVEYTIELKYRLLLFFGSQNHQINVIAANDLVHNVDCYSGSPPNNIEQELIGEISTSGEAIKTDYKKTITFCLKDYYEQLWIYPSGDNVTLKLDEVNISTTCSPEVVFDSSYLPGFYQTDKTITIGNPNTLVENNPGISTHLKAEEEIAFEIQTLIAIDDNVEFFLAEITPCKTDCPGNSGGTKILDEIEIGNFDTKFEIYPNPVNSDLHVKLGTNLFHETNVAERIQMNIYDSLGQAVYSNNEYYSDSTIDMSDFSAGVYYVSILFDGQVFTEKVIVQN